MSFQRVLFPSFALTPSALGSSLIGLSVCVSGAGWQAIRNLPKPSPPPRVKKKKTPTKGFLCPPQAAVALQEVAADDLWLCVLGGSWPESRRQSSRGREHRPMAWLPLHALK